MLTTELAEVKIGRDVLFQVRPNSFIPTRYDVYIADPDAVRNAALHGEVYNWAILKEIKTDLTDEQLGQFFIDQIQRCQQEADGTLPELPAE